MECFLFLVFSFCLLCFFLSFSGCFSVISGISKTMYYQNQTRENPCKIRGDLFAGTPFLYLVPGSVVFYKKQRRIFNMNSVQKIQTSVSHASFSANFLYVLKSKKAVTNIFPAVTSFVISLISNIRFESIGHFHESYNQMETNDNRKYFIKLYTHTYQNLNE